MGLKVQIQSFLEEQLPAEVDLVDVILGKDMGQLHIQVLLDQEGGVDLDFLTKYNRIIGALLDGRDIPGPYILEVSSAGLERPLVRPDNYRRFMGRKAKLSLNVPVNNEKILTGIIAGLSEDARSVYISNEGCQLEISLANIAKANLVFEF